MEKTIEKELIDYANYLHEENESFQHFWDCTMDTYPEVTKQEAWYIWEMTSN